MIKVGDSIQRLMYKYGWKVGGFTILINDLLTLDSYERLICNQI